MDSELSPRTKAVLVVVYFVLFAAAMAALFWFLHGVLRVWFPSEVGFAIALLLLGFLVGLGTGDYRATKRLSPEEHAIQRWELRDTRKGLAIWTVIIVAMAAVLWFQGGN